MSWAEVIAGVLRKSNPAEPLGALLGAAIGRAGLTHPLFKPLPFRRKRFPEQRPRVSSSRDSAFRLTQQRGPAQRTLGPKARKTGRLRSCRWLLEQLLVLSRGLRVRCCGGWRGWLHLFHSSQNRVVIRARRRLSRFRRSCRRRSPDNG